MTPLNYSKDQAPIYCQHCNKKISRTSITVTTKTKSGKIKHAHGNCYRKQEKIELSVSVESKKIAFPIGSL